jgi:hypothetical protein
VLLYATLPAGAHCSPAPTSAQKPCATELHSLGCDDAVHEHY